MQTDLNLLDFIKTLDDSQVPIQRTINAIKLKFDQSDNRKDNVEINSEVIQLIEMIKDSDIFKVVMMNSLQREVKRSFLPVDFIPNQGKGKASEFLRAKLQENVNSCLARVSK